MHASPIQRYRKPLAISSWLSFAIALTFYWITVDPGASYWDCSEYITVASKLEVGHPPGNPIWMLAMRVATIPFEPATHALVINLWSGIFMAFATFFLCRLIFLPTKIYFNKLSYKGEISPFLSDVFPSLIAIGASLCFALCDSAWFSAVEAEVYAMSAFLTALSLWIIMVWWHEKSVSRQSRLLILLAYITGLSLGVHQLNLLLIPVFALVILYKLHPERINPIITFLWIAGSIALIGIILMGFIPGILFGAQSFELFSVNNLGLPYDSGILMFLTLIFLLIIIALLFSSHFPLLTFHFSLSPFNFPLSTFLYSFLFLLLGFSSFGIILIRAKAAPPMNEGNPDNIFSLSSYIQREQYPSSPLIYGETPYSRAMYEEKFIDGKPDYSRYLLEKEKGIYQPVLEDAKLHYRSGMLSHKDSVENDNILKKQHGYLLSDYKFSQVLTPELNMWFPRMTSRNINARHAYEDWGGMIPENMEHLPISETVDKNGKYQPKIDLDGKRTPAFSYRPTYYQNLKYFASYQAYYMYFRYLFWNFIGRQNDFPSNGEIEHGNFITGISVIDKEMLGDSDYFPSEIWKDNKGRNRYFAIPFILGIWGIIFLLSGKRKDRRYLTLITLFFFMTGLAIVIYLNQAPGEPRERDYTFLGSYMAFVMWIAAGIVGIAVLFIKLKLKKAAVVMSSIISLGVPALMAAENFDDHDRRHRFEPTFFASSLLDFEMPAIIFSHGDNSSFPLWYASEVLGMGPHHTPIDVTYLSLPSYLTNLKKQGEKSINTIADTPEIAYGKYLLTRIPHDSISEPKPLPDAIRELYNSSQNTPQWSTSEIIIPDGKGKTVTINLHDFSKGSSFLSFKHLMLLDILAAQLENSPHSKILFFPYLIDRSFYQPLDSVLKPTLFGKIYAPGLNDSIALNLLKTSIDRELKKLEQLNIRPHYIDPVLADRTTRYRGELIIAATELLNSGDSIFPVKIADAIERFLPYSDILPGTFTIADSTFYEGKEYLLLLSKLNAISPNKQFQNSAQSLDSLISARHREWLQYYYSLSPSQRKTLSNRSRRLLLP